MKTITLGLATAALLGLAALSAPASAFPAPQLAVSSHTNVVDVAFRHHRKVCTLRTVVKRSHGHRIVRKVRTCR